MPITHRIYSQKENWIDQQKYKPLKGPEHFANGGVSRSVLYAMVYDTLTKWYLYFTEKYTVSEYKHLEEGRYWSSQIEKKTEIRTTIQIIFKKMLFFVTCC
jgi:hypothetical protein